MLDDERLTMSDIADIIDLLRRCGDSQYGGEAVTQLEHSLQSAALAESAHASPALIAAALLHDIGHLLHNLPDDAPDLGTDDHHETSAGQYLARLFPPAVCEPVRLHVAAKRFLCATDPAYHAALSRPSQISLALQGGPMTAQEAAEFRQHPHFIDAVQLRQWDDEAKVPGLPTPTLEHFAQYVARAAGPRPPA